MTPIRAVFIRHWSNHGESKMEFYFIYLNSVFFWIMWKTKTKRLYQTRALLNFFPNFGTPFTFLFTTLIIHSRDREREWNISFLTSGNRNGNKKITNRPNNTKWKRGLTIVWSWLQWVANMLQQQRKCQKYLLQPSRHWSIISVLTDISIYWVD